jgi:hypothetical protein
MSFMKRNPAAPLKNQKGSGVHNGSSRGLTACGATTNCTPQVNTIKEIFLNYTEDTNN